MASSPPEADLLDLFVRPLHEAGLHYVVAGSVAAMYFGEPRLTIDVDIPIFLGQRDVAVIETLFKAPDYYCPPNEMLRAESERECRGHFNVIHVPTGLKADFYPANRDETFAWACQHKIAVESGSGTIWLAPPEYVILWKLIFFQEGKSTKHLRDISRILSLRSDLAHRDYLLGEIGKRRLESAWEESQPS